MKYKLKDITPTDINNKQAINFRYYIAYQLIGLICILFYWFIA